MAAMKRVVGTATGRGPDANGFLGRIAAFATASIASGGAGWYMVDNMLSNPTVPGIVISDIPAPGPNDGAKLIHIYYQTAYSECLIFAPVYYWNVATHTGYYWARHQAHTIDGGQFNYWLFGGPQLFAIISKVGNKTATPSVLDEWQGDAELLAPETAGSTFAEDMYLETGDTQNQISLYTNLNGFTSLLDANGLLHFSTIVSSGNLQVNVYRDAARTLLIGHTTNSNVLGTRNITADFTSGLTGSLNVDLIAGTSSNANISCRFNRVRVQTGHGANFTIGDFYFLTDFQNYTPRISYSRITNISGDLLTFESVRVGRDFESGGRISPYRHRFMSFGYGNWRASSLDPAASTPSSYTVAAIPHLSRQGFEYDISGQALTSTIGESNGRVGLSHPEGYMFRGGGKTKKDKWKCGSGLIYEYLSFTDGTETGMTEAYGRPRNIILAPNFGGAVLGDSITLGGIEYVIILQDSSRAYCLRYTESDV